ncbi:hypothetical protein N7471_001966 [Penicillium samsonianum]|uniref:uncharacterized protein n=1 Tax=Penicillium samsonianum TaxID=1882272 RepID=UPI002547CD8F|nr:uncharacterized protein N7471_001966 [Penicillium samsonianum]KAJ6142513.1 hypothetical protein N7471_001966 [Penicillium samsonianum]
MDRITISGDDQLQFGTRRGRLDAGDGAHRWPRECTSYLRLHGRFSNCISVEVLNSLTACANCHWAGRDDRYHYRHTVATQHPPIAEPTRHHQVPPSATTTDIDTPTPDHQSSRRRLFEHLTNLAQALESSRNHLTRLEDLLDQVHSIQSPSTADRLLQKTVDNIYSSHHQLHQRLREIHNDVMDILDAPVQT